MNRDGSNASVQAAGRGGGSGGGSRRAMARKRYSNQQGELSTATPEGTSRGITARGTGAIVASSCGNPQEQAARIEHPGFDVSHGQEWLQAQRGPALVATASLADGPTSGTRNASSA